MKSGAVENVAPTLPPYHPAREVIAKFNRHFFTEGKSWGRIGKNEYRALVLAINPPEKAK